MVSDLKFFAKNCVQLTRQKKFFYGFFSSHLFTPFNSPFAHTSWSPMSKIFRYLESLGKSNGKMWSQIWTFFTQKWCKIPRQNFFKTDFCHFSLRLKVFLPPIPEVQRPILFWFSESLGKSNGKKWSQIVKLLLIEGLQLPRKAKCFFDKLCSPRINILFYGHLSPVTCHQPPITCHLSPVTCHLSLVTCHLSPVTCQLSPTTCYL